jgi:DNA-binding GntR family transcriptional regulator
MARPRNKRAGGGSEVSTAQGVLQTLRERITRHELPPGSKLFENELSSEFGVSRAKIRDVLAILQQRGLIQRIPKRGAVVERLDPSQVFHIYTVREALEGVCARLATQNMPPESWQDLVNLFGKPIEEDIRRGDLEAYIAKLETLRRRTVEGAQNPILADMLANIQDRTRMIIRRIIILPGRAEIGLKEHRAVLQAMRKGDAEAAEAAKRANIRSGAEYLKRYQSFVL